MLKLSIALRIQDLDIVEPYIAREHLPHRLRPGYDLWQVDGSSTAKRVPIPNRPAMERNRKRVEELVYQASYRDHSGKIYQNEIFIHIAQRVLANQPLVIKYRKFLPPQLCWGDENAAPYYLLNATDHMVSFFLQIR